MPVSTFERIGWLAILLNTTKEAIINEALELGLEYLEGTKVDGNAQ